MRLMRKIVSSGKPDADDGPKPANRSSISSIHSTSKKSSLVPPKQKQAEETTVPGEASVILLPLSDDIDEDGEPFRRYTTGSSYSSSGTLGWDRRGDSDGLMTPLSGKSLDLFNEEFEQDSQYESVFENIGLSSLSGAYRDREVTLQRGSGDERFGATFVAYKEKLYVVHVIPQSPADFAGLHFGQQVVSINGSPAKGFDAQTAGVAMTTAVELASSDEDLVDPPLDMESIGPQMPKLSDSDSASPVSITSSLKDIDLHSEEEEPCRAHDRSPLHSGERVHTGCCMGGKACDMRSNKRRCPLLTTRLVIRQADFLRKHLILGTAKPEPIGIDFVFGNITFVRKSGRAYRAGIRPNHTILFVDELSCMGGFNGSSPCRDQDIVNFIHRSSGDIEITIIPTAVLSELLRDIDYVPPIPNTQLQSDDEL